MNDYSAIIDKIDDLENMVEQAKDRNASWAEVWEMIREIGFLFKDVRFPTREEREDEWLRYQRVVDDVKNERDTRISESYSHLENVREYANEISPPADVIDLIFSFLDTTLNTVGEIIGERCDTVKNELENRNEIKRNAWFYFEKNKREMTKADKEEAYNLLKDASDELDKAWEDWKKARNNLFDARQEKIQEEIDYLEEIIEHLSEVIDKKRENIQNNQDKLEDAWSDEFREKVETWITEDEDSINDIEEKIESIKEKISYKRSLLR